MLKFILINDSLGVVTRRQARKIIKKIRLKFI
jgi:hypothetical protein